MARSQTLSQPIAPRKARRQTLARLQAPRMSFSTTRIMTVTEMHRRMRRKVAKAAAATTEVVVNPDYYVVLNALRSQPAVVARVQEDDEFGIHLYQGLTNHQIFVDAVAPDRGMSLSFRVASALIVHLSGDLKGDYMDGPYLRAPPGVLLADATEAFAKAGIRVEPFDD